MTIIIYQINYYVARNSLSDYICIAFHLKISDDARR